MQSWKKPTDEMIERALASVKKEIDRRFFFSRLKNPLWIQPLAERGYFQSPPSVTHLADGSVQFPFWPELQFLKSVAKDAPDEVARIAADLPKVDNPQVYDDILDIAVQLPGEQSAKLKPKILEYASMEHQFLAHRYADLLAHWTAEQQIMAALELAKALVQFSSDPDSESKQTRRKENLGDLTTRLKPRPRVDQLDYQEILEKGVRPLAEREPYQVARILIDATASMIRLGMHPEDRDKNKGEDISEIWCQRLNEQENDYHDVRGTLVHTLTFACEKVFEKVPESIGSLDDVLRKQRWKIFTRLRHHLYALYLNEQTKPWIRESILAHEDYARWEYPYEFQRMIRRACEHFGAALLTRRRAHKNLRSDSERSLEGGFPGVDGRAIHRGSCSTQRQRHFHRMQLKPFASVLFGEYAAYFQRLEAEADEQISDEAYSPVGKIEAGIHIPP